MWSVKFNGCGRSGRALTDHMHINSKWRQVDLV